jgi:hypothetical protein
VVSVGALVCCFADISFFCQEPDVFVYIVLWPVVECVLFLLVLVEGSLEVKLPIIWTDEKQSREEAERRERIEERRVEEKE